MKLDIDIKLHHPPRLGSKPFLLDATIQSDAAILGIMGPSGAGKTSILDAIAGISPNVSGRITIGTTTILDTTRGINLPARKRKIGYVFQDSQIFPHLSVEDNLRFGLQCGSGNHAEFSQIVDLLRLGPLLKASSAELSGGERQRVALGRAILSAPRLLLLDEPVTGVEHAHRNAILPYLQELYQSRQIPMIYVSHQEQEIAQIAHRFYSLVDGELRLNAPKSAINP